MMADGFTVTVTVNGVPVQVKEEGVTIYVTVIGELVELLKVPLKNVALVAPASPEIPVIAPGAFQVYKVLPGTTSPFTPLVGETEKLTPEHVATTLVPITGVVH